MLAAVLRWSCGLGLAAAAAAHAAPTEWWLLAARLDSGEQVFVEFTLTDIGPGERNAAAIGNWLAPDGALTPFSRAKLGGAWTPSPDGKRIDLGKFVFDRTQPRAQLRVEKKSLQLTLDFPLAAAPLATHTLAGGKWTQELWAAGAPLNASFWKRGMAAPLAGKGRVALSRRKIEGPESKLAQRRLEAFSLGAAPIYVLEVAKGKRAERWVVAFDAHGKLLAQESATQVPNEKLGAPAARLALAGPLAPGVLSAGAPLASYDPLADLPAPIRFVLGLRLRSAWMASPFAIDVREGARAARREGTAIASYTFYQ
jgi:hypothetical protein